MRLITAILIMFLFISCSFCILAAQTAPAPVNPAPQAYTRGFLWCGANVSPAPSGSWLNENPSNKTPSGVDPLVKLPLTLFYLVIICFLAYIILKFLGSKNLMMGSSFSKNKLIKIIEKQALGPKQSLYIIETGGKYLLIGFTDNNISVLAELDQQKIDEILAQKKESEAENNNPKRFWKDFFKQRLPFSKK